MSQIYINYDGIESSAERIRTENGNLRDILSEIERLINSLAGEWESDSATRIREKITGMEPRFDQYHDVVDNYVKFLHNMVADYRATEQTNTANADQFI